MKQEFDREMEALLRGTKGGAAHTRAPRAAVEPAHLDADELNAYAENALPPATRSRYVSHLADCADCRRIVTGIALSAGAEMGRERSAAQTPAVESAVASSPLSWLAALFSPRVLRYAAPVLALAIVGALALVVLRQQRGGEGNLESQVAQQSPAAEGDRRVSVTQPTTGDATNASVANASVAPPKEVEKSPAPGGEKAVAGGVVSAPPLASTREMETREGQLAAAAPKDAGEVSEAVTVAADEMKAKAIDSAVSQPARPAAAAPPPAHAEPREIARAKNPEDDRVREQKQDNSLAKSEEREGSRRDEDAARRGSNMQIGRGGGDRITPRNSKAGQDGPGTSGEYSVSGPKKNTSGARARTATTGETRSVAGREFRRQDGAWVETRYNPSMSTSIYRRGTESFRALVADIPEIGRVAEQLQGTVIVVARGRAYKIQ